jgi:ATP-dependent helicase/nuclease subunit A
LATSNATLPFGDAPEAGEARLVARDRAARERAVDPRYNVALEASAGTGKTRVLVDRYINLLRAGVDPANILAITFTRKAAVEMRDRILATLRAAAARGELTPARWRELRDRTSDIAISTIDAFCLSLLREFPLEADLDPGFSVADETELPRLVDQALDGALRICRAAAREDDHVALVFAQLGERRARTALAALVERRLVAPRVLAASLARRPADLDARVAAARAAAELQAVFDAMRGGFDRFAFTGPLAPAFTLLTRSLRALREVMEAGGVVDPALVQATSARARHYFLTQEGKPRSRSPYPRGAFASAVDWRTHTDLVAAHAEAVARVIAAYRRDLNALVSRGIWRMFRIAEAEYRRTLDAHAVVDFSDLLLRALDLLRRMDEFSRSRYRLESRYHHVLVDEFQDTSRAQWELVALLIQSWGEGAGLAAGGPLPPSIFIVGDRKQSIYGFRDADVSVLREAAGHIETLRPDRDVRRSISRSFRAVPALLAFVNDVCQDMDKTAGDEAFQYEETDRFPVESAGSASRDPACVRGEALGLVVAPTPDRCAEIAAAEIARLVALGVPVRDRDTGVARPVRAGDVAILFRSRESHREFEAALTRRGLRSYVYKGLGFFDADEIKDVLALVWYLADPDSNLRAAALLRSRCFGLSDEGLRLLSPGLAEALGAAAAPAAAGALGEGDARVLAEARASTARWRGLVDRIPPAELVDLVLTESAYAFELRGPRLPQARENLKKVRALLRRLQNRGYATLARLAAHLNRLALGDDANAVIDAADAVNLMTVHASKGLEFPVVFLVNLARGTSNRRDPVRWSREGTSVAVGDFDGDVDEARAVREREETKRLLYVALTRARDRLYLAAALKDGDVVPGRGSLADVLPPSLLRQIAGAGESLEWRASSGAVHRFQICAGDADEVDHATATETARADSPPLAADFEPLPAGEQVRRPAADSAVTVERGDTERLIGRVVHRMLQRRGFDAPDGPAAREAALRMLRSGEMRDVPADHAATEVADRAAAAYRAICGRPEVRALYDAGERLHEVPFTMRLDGVSVRGTIDCLIRSAPDRLTVLEFKTGGPRDEHRAQLDLYRRAAEQLFPGCAIDARLVYAG